MFDIGDILNKKQEHHEHHEGHKHGNLHEGIQSIYIKGQASSANKNEF